MFSIKQLLSHDQEFKNCGLGDRSHTCITEKLNACRHYIYMYVCIYIKIDENKCTGYMCARQRQTWIEEVTSSSSSFFFFLKKWRSHFQNGNLTIHSSPSEATLSSLWWFPCTGPPPPLLLHLHPSANACMELRNHQSLKSRVSLWQARYLGLTT